MDKTSIAINIMLLFCAASADPRTFPRTISFGTGSSAYQIEGAWNEDGKSENIWDHWIHEDPSRIKINATADIACNSYNKMLTDIYYVSKIGVQHYRFSIPWSRILPTGFADEINMKAILHYQNMLKYLKYYNITPVVTLYYHDLPQSLQDIGGWTNPMMAKYFADYARVCFQFFRSVEYWITFNDPKATCRRGYGSGTFAPGINSDGVGEYLCTYTVLKAHAAAYHLYKEEFKGLKGKMSMAIDMVWYEPYFANDKAAVERKIAFEFGLYANPIYKGNWPQEVIDRVDYRSEKENFTKSRLPKFTDEEINYIKGTSDFMAISLFYTIIVKDIKEAEFGDPSYMKDVKVELYLRTSWKLAVNGQPIVPQSARQALAWLSSSFDDPEIFITGNGIPDSAKLGDKTRVSYFRDYLKAILDAIEKDGVNVIGYTAWSFLDSFQWTDGYTYKFGFYWMDFENGYRLEKDSLVFYRQVAKTFTIPEEVTTTTSAVTTDVTDPTVSDTTPGSATKMALYSSVILTIVIILQVLL
ncbi:myrosinase 1-like [Anoplophora glabripennis]|uniref:myrosinase 1-like n=1 Tax=Anoplophora glabripennis TaxID=217634 RepID=UPI000874004A|nr:myrosinase 1-like [Anoplophora glabripennis]